MGQQIKGNGSLFVFQIFLNFLLNVSTVSKVFESNLASNMIFNCDNYITETRSITGPRLFVLDKVLYSRCYRPQVVSDLMILRGGGLSDDGGQDWSLGNARPKYKLSSRRRTVLEGQLADDSDSNNGNARQPSGSNVRGGRNLNPKRTRGSRQIHDAPGWESRQDSDLVEEKLDVDIGQVRRQKSF